MGRCVPDVPVPRVLLEGGDDPVEVGQFLQLGDVIPGHVSQPARAGVVHLVLSVQHLGARIKAGEKKALLHTEVNQILNKNYC